MDNHPLILTVFIPIFMLAGMWACLEIGFSMVVIDLEYPRVGFITLRHMDRAMIQVRDLMH